MHLRSRFLLRGCVVLYPLSSGSFERAAIRAFLGRFAGFGNGG